MKPLFEAFCALPSWTGILLLGGAVGFVAVVALIVCAIAFRAGRRFERGRHNYYSTKRRELASITG